VRVIRPAPEQGLAGEDAAKGAAERARQLSRCIYFAHRALLSLLRILEVLVGVTLPGWVRCLCVLAVCALRTGRRSRRSHRAGTVRAASGVRVVFLIHELHGGGAQRAPAWPAFQPIARTDRAT